MERANKRDKGGGALGGITSSFVGSDVIAGNAGVDELAGD
jgi:hypothetical protein